MTRRFRVLGSALGVLATFAALSSISCGSDSSDSSKADPTGGSGGAPHGSPAGGATTGGRGGVSEEALQAACDDYAIGTAHEERPCEAGQVMLHGEIVRALGEGGAGGAPASPWDPEESEADYQSAREDCAGLIAAFPACGVELEDLFNCFGNEALFVCTEDDTQTLKWTSYDCNGQIDEFNRCLEASGD